MNHHDITIIGAGICGLTLARRLADSQLFGDLAVIEKSRAVGGRMATRRTETAKFDHGAQFYSLTGPMNSLNERWQKASLVEPWFRTDDGALRIKSRLGMTSLAKDLATELEIVFSKKVVNIERVDDDWNLVVETGERFPARTVVMTCPAPQALDILRASHIGFDPELTNLSYAKALVGLFEGKPSFGEADLNPNGMIEKPGSEIDSIVDQRLKGLSQTPAWTVTMNADFSQRFFDAEESVALEEIDRRMRALLPWWASTSGQLKKWRFSQPRTTFKNPFAEVAPGLFLAGDAFSRPSINGAVRSAVAMSEFLIEKQMKEKSE